MIKNRRLVFFTGANAEFIFALKRYQYRFISVNGIFSCKISKSL